MLGDTPVQPPDQPMKVEAMLAAAVRVTDVLCVKLAAHAAPQLIPAGAEETLPAPVPGFETKSETSFADTNVRPDRTLTAEISEAFIAPLAFRSKRNVALFAD